MNDQFMDDPIAELRDAAEAKQVAEAVNAITADLIRNAAKYPAQVRDLPRLVTAMEKSIKSENYKDALTRGQQLDKHLESFTPADEPAREAKLVLRHRLLVLAKIMQ
ncbi:MAG TPA: hypothetical protein VGG22_02765 [Candidatus Baltobacteraceae bacterium]|jgi:hypothetical protein